MFSGLCPKCYLENLYRSSITCTWNAYLLRYPTLKYILPVLTELFINKKAPRKKFAHNPVKMTAKE